MDKEVIEALLKESADRDVIVVSRGINRQLHQDLSRKIREEQTHDKCTIFLTTYGGDPDAAYRIARCLRHHYEHVRLVVPSFCKSAGTLITIIADELVIGDLGELGPLDIQVAKNSEIAERSSGLDIIQALQATLNHAQTAFRSALLDIRGGSRLSTKLAGEFAAEIAVGVTAPLYAQIDPIRLGEMQRAMRIAHEYGLRLNAYTNSLRPGALDKLVADYPAHGFVIDRKEAGTLFATVSAPTDRENEFCFTLWGLLESQQNFGPEFIVPPSNESTGASNGQVTAEPSGEGEGGGNEAIEQLPANSAETNG
jgi:hypothetical protein